MFNSAPMILVVDDDDLSRDVLVRALEAEGYSVKSVATSMECLRLLDEGAAVDLLIIDVVMPPSMPHGFSLGRMARVRNPAQKLLYISGFREALPESELVRAEEPILGKPVRIPEFLAAVRSCLEGP